MYITRLAPERNDGQRAVWIGGSDRRMEGTWLWEWSRKSIGSNAAWGMNNPSNTVSNAPEGQDCMNIVFHYGGLYDDDYCFREYRYFCEVTPTPGEK